MSELLNVYVDFRGRGRLMGEREVENDNAQITPLPVTVGILEAMMLPQRKAAK